MVETTSNILKELEKASLDGKLDVGMNSALRALKQGTASKVIYSKDTPQVMRDELEYYTRLANIHAVMFDGTSRDLGVACKRTHTVLAAVIMKA
jgi:large subunit ribosomal protein L30e